MPQTVLASFDSGDKASETLALGKPEQLNVELTGLKPGLKILVETLDKQNGNALAGWEKLGEPDNLSREQTRLLREQAAAIKKETFTTDAKGNFKLQRTVEPWSVVLIREI
jgi:xylan 1,4-beta-xylosidase